MPTLIVVLVLCLSSFGVISEAWANEKTEAQNDLNDNTPRAQRLDALFAELKKAKNQTEAQKFSNQIWMIWGSWDDDAIDLLMRRTQTAIDMRDFSTALDLLDQVIAIEPKHSEAWNRRATVHYFNGDFDLSIADVEQTLALEPRHFGALSGLARMLTALGEREKAISALQKTLEIYPALEGAQAALLRLLEHDEQNKL